MTEHSDFDHVSGRTTTGHEWDGIKELNTPLPRWWVIDLLFVHRLGGRILDRLSGMADGLRATPPACCITRRAPTSLSNWPTSKRSAATRWSRSARRRSPISRRTRRCWRWRAPAARRCSATIARHATARGAAGAKGFPNLNDDDWLWGGTLDQIMQTIQFGARSGHAKTHEGQMLAFGKDGILKREEIVTVANYVRSLSGLPTRSGI